MSISDRALGKPIVPDTMPEHEQPISEQYRIVAKKWVDANAASRMLREMKTTVLEQQKNALVALDPNLPDSHAERQVKASPSWEEYIRNMVDAETKSNLLEVQLEYIKMKDWERKDANANRRQEMRMGGN